MRDGILKKLKSLFLGELAAVFMFALVWLVYSKNFSKWQPYLTSYSALYAFSLLEFILLQGSYYWYLKIKQVKLNGCSNLSHRQLNIFSVFNKLNIILTLLGIPLLMYQLITSSGIFLWSLFLYFFAIIEYINYYHIRLSYFTALEIQDLIRQKGPRASKLSRELKSLKREKYS